jgi:OHCU decarboxylase
MKYPRNMLGYGQKPPDPRWPNNAKLAVQFVVNYEEGGESCTLHGDNESEAFLSEIIGATSWKNKRHLNMESLYEYGSRSGFWRLHRIFTSSKIPVTVFGVTTALARSPNQVEAMKSADWEIACHGLKWIDYKNKTKNDEKKDMLEAIKLHNAVTGKAPKGWYLGRCSENTLHLVNEHGGFDYISDSYSDELPYWFEHAGNSQLVIPYTLDVNDMRFVTAQGFNASTQFYEYLKDTFDFLLDEGRSGSPKMMTIGLHCRLMGRPGRAIALKRFIEYIKDFSDIWIAKRIDIADHWKTNFPPQNRKIIPSKLSRKRFLELFGNIFENSPWLTKKVFDHEISPTMDSSVGLHNAFLVQFRLSSKQKKMNVLKEHPDLAGKLHQNNLLTKESQKEQKSAGLNNLTPSELHLFTTLNTKYSKKFKHPFIKAVTGADKFEIREEFEKRINNSIEIEFILACKEVEKIADIRIKKILNE